MGRFESHWHGACQTLICVANIVMQTHDSTTFTTRSVLVLELVQSATNYYVAEESLENVTRTIYQANNACNLATKPLTLCYTSEHTLLLITKRSHTTRYFYSYRSIKHILCNLSSFVMYTNVVWFPVGKLSHHISSSYSILVFGLLLVFFWNNIIMFYFKVITAQFLVR